MYRLFKFQGLSKLFNYSNTNKYTIKIKVRYRMSCHVKTSMSKVATILRIEPIKLRLFTVSIINVSEIVVVRRADITQTIHDK